MQSTEAITHLRIFEAGRGRSSISFNTYDCGMRRRFKTRGSGVVAANKATFECQKKWGKSNLFEKYFSKKLLVGVKETTT